MKSSYKEIFNLLEVIKVEPRTTKKLQLLQEFPHRDVLKRFLHLVYDPHVVFGITSKAIKKVKGGIVNEVNPDILESLLQFRAKHTKVAFFEAETDWLSVKARQHLLNALDKNLNLGIGVKLINKALPGTVSDFQVMLAYKQSYDRFELAYSDIDTVYYNVKMDGIRCIVKVNDKDDIQFYSRNGLAMEDFLIENIKYEIRKNFNLFQGRILDGEIYSEHFQKLMRIYRRKNVDINSVFIRNSTRFAIFDLIDMADFPLTKRVKEMRWMSVMLGASRFISFLQYYELQNDYQRIWDTSRQYIDNGEEGIIIKHPEHTYQKRRSNSWLKFKNKETLDLQVIGYFEGNRGTQFEGALGGLIFKYKGKEVRCGSGFTEDERKLLWENKEELLGCCVEISYMEETATGSLRHPVFERFRFDLERI